MVDELAQGGECGYPLLLGQVRTAVDDVGDGVVPARVFPGDSQFILQAVRPCYKLGVDGVYPPCPLRRNGLQFL